MSGREQVAFEVLHAALCVRRQPEVVLDANSVAGSRLNDAEAEKVQAGAVMTAQGFILTAPQVETLAFYFAVMSGLTIILWLAVVPVVRDLLEMLLMRWPAFRAWDRKRRRMARIEWVADMRERRRLAAEAASQALVDASARGVRW